MQSHINPSHATLDDVRLAIYRQHTLLAQLLDELEAHAQRVLMGEDAAGHMNVALVLVRGRLLRHLVDEEVTLAPLLPSLRHEGLARIRASLAGHDEQRARVEGLLHDRTVFADPKTIAHEALAFVRELRADIREEDAVLRALG